MKNRWFHPPELHSPAPGTERSVGWLELFYDLIYVATIIQLGNALSSHVGVLGFLAFAGLFAPVWLLWTGFTFYSNRFVVNDFLHRAIVFLQMFAVGGMAVYIPEVIDGDTRGFALCYAFARYCIVGLYVRSLLQTPASREFSKHRVLVFSAEATIWLISAFLPSPWVYVCWALGLGIALSIPLSRHSRDLSLRYPPDVLHMSERYGLLIIIVLGESFVKVLTSVYEATPTPQTVSMAALVLIITCSLWWIYFDDVAGSRIKAKRAASFVWIYTHLPLTMAITATGVAVKKIVFLDPFIPAPDKYRWLVCVTLAMVFLFVGIIDAVTERRQSDLSDRTRVNSRIASAFVVMLLAPTGAFLPTWVFVLGLVGLCVGQVVFDLMAAPLEADEEMAKHDAQGAVGFGDQSLAEKTDEKTRRMVASDAILRGTPNELRRDMYFYFMEGSWWRLMLSLLAMYVFVNFIFAALFMLEPGSVDGVETLAEAFFFSVQTMSTIGYGVMSPLTQYGHVLVTIEAALGLLGVALATGLMFAKAARPSAAILFSDVVVVTRHNGIDTLMIRAGNARGNDVVDAAVTVAVLKSEVSPEGHEMRKLYDLQLRRSRQPIFILSWTIIHEIDENSPLYGIDWDNLDDHLATMIITMTGHDGTYGQTTYARQQYFAEDFRVGHRFVDILSDMDDGRLLVDYTRFHSTEPDPAFGGSA